LSVSRRAAHAQSDQWWGRRFRLPSPLAGGSFENLQSAARPAVWISGALVALCVAVLWADYALASRRGPIDDQLIKTLQEQVKSDAQLAPRLAGEQKRVTAARHSRKSRDNALAWTLIFASATFLTAAKRVTQPASPSFPKKLGKNPGTQAEAPAPRPQGSRQWWGRRFRLPRPLAGDSFSRSDNRTSVPSGDPKGEVTGETACPTSTNALDLTFVDQLVAREGRGKESAIILLQAIQTHYRYLPDEALRRLVELTEITPAEVAGTSSFYGQFRRSPVGRHVVRVCHGTACHVAGARQITEELRRHLAIPEGADTDPERLFTVDEVACVGCCSLAPVLTVDGHTCGSLTPATACDALTPFEETEPA